MRIVTRMTGVVHEAVAKSTQICSDKRKAFPAELKSGVPRLGT